MVLWLKPRKSRSSPGIIAGGTRKSPFTKLQRPLPGIPERRLLFFPESCVLNVLSQMGHGDAGWSSPPVVSVSLKRSHKRLPGCIAQPCNGDAGWSSPPVVSVSLKRSHKRLPGCIAQPCNGDAGWSSPVARQAHNLKVVGSNPTPATNNRPRFGGVFCCLPN